jgi:hypothetical protein
MRKMLLALALVAIISSAASANTWVWWELESSNNGAFANGGKGLPLRIFSGVMVPPGDYTFTLVMKMQTDATVATKGLIGYAMHLWRGPDTRVSSISDTNLNPLSWTLAPTGTGTAGEKILADYGRARGAATELGVGQTAQTFVRMTLATPYFCEGLSIYQSVAAGRFAFAPPTANTVYFGGNPGVSGATAVNFWNTASATFPVILFDVPEPATAALLGLGLLLLTRDRSGC